MSTIACTASSIPSSQSGVQPAQRGGSLQIAAGEAMALKARSASVLRVRQGRLWVTRDLSAGHGSDDLVLGVGDALTVPAGQRVVMEPWDRGGAVYTWDAAA